MAEYSARTDKTVSDRYMTLDTDGQCQVMYIWVDGSGENLRAKTKTMDMVPEKPEGKFTKPQCCKE